MKRNIDLTDNEIFSRSRNNFFDTELLLKIKSIKSMFPWSLYKITDNSGDEYDLDHQKESIIAVGNREQRREVQCFREMDSGNYCECCGKRINLTPWNEEFGLCYKCEENFEKTSHSNNKCLWRKE